MADNGIEQRIGDAAALPVELGGSGGSANLERYAALLELKRDVEALAARVSSAIDESARAVLAESERTGRVSMKIDGFGVTVSSKLRAAYDPEKWDSILRWVAETNPGVVHRRLSDAKVIDLVTNGGALPDGLTLEPYKSVSYRFS